MLTISVRPLLEFRGVKPSIRYVQSLGFTYGSARYIYSGDMKSMNLQMMEKLCVGLRCTPNDILFYTPGNEPLTAQHPLHSLNKARYYDEIKEALQQMDNEEVELVREQVKAILEKKKLGSSENK